MEKFMRSWWGLAASASIIMALIVEFGLPVLFPVLRANWIRLLLILMVAAALGVTAAWRWWRARNASDQIANELAKPEPGESENDVLLSRMRDALVQLKTTQDGRRDYLYAKPWYLIIGPPGAGKTTALLNSGVRFPWRDSALKGVGGTRNLDFWFADEAVLVDTAGRYTTQESDGLVDAAGWMHFLRLLRRTRPLRPINGIIVALGVDELMSASREQLDAHASAVRRRLTEIHRVLDVTVPVYLLFPKADLLAGFDEFFADLSAEGRRAVFGETFAIDNPIDSASVIAGFDHVLEALAARNTKRLQDEPDQRRRSLLLAFPGQVASLRSRFARFVDGAFLSIVENREHVFRGFYFASGVQEGAPLDRVLSAMATVYDGPSSSGRAQTGGRAFFLNRLLTEVVFLEAGLVRPVASHRRRMYRQLAAGLAAMSILFVLLAAAWLVSFAHNRTLQASLLSNGQKASSEIRADGVDLVDVHPNDPDLEQLLPILDDLRSLPRGFDDQQNGPPPVAMRLGLFQSSHAEAAKQVYYAGLQRMMLPRLLERLEQVMRDNAQQPMLLYEPLKAYLMLGGYGPLDRQAVRAWVTTDWRTNSLAGADRTDIRIRLTHHLDALLNDPDLGRVWSNRRAPLDGALITSTRAAVQTLSLADRAYAVLRQRADAMGRQAWQADAVLAAGDVQAFRNGAAVMQIAVPWFFTLDGYRRGYQPGLLNVETELGRDLWVLGPDAAKASIRDQIPAVRTAVASDYAQDYIKYWDAVITTLQPADYFASPAALGAFTRVPSPLKTLLLEVRHNTSLGSDGTIAANSFDAGLAIQDHFKTIADFSGQSVGATAPVDDLVKAIRDAVSASNALRIPGAALGGSAVQGQLATALGNLSTSAAVAPPQLQSFVAQATRSGQGAATRSAETALDQQYASAVRPTCLSVSDGHYPFARDARADVAVADLQHVYGANGLIDAFFRDRLQSLIDTGPSTWRWRAADVVASRLNPNSASEFQKAAAIRDLIAGGLALNVSLAGMTGNLDGMDLSAGGTSYHLDKKDVGQHPMIWTPAGLPEAHVSLVSGGREVYRDATTGPWALFRLVDLARSQPAGSAVLLLTFGAGAQSATVRVRLPTATNPFARGGPFSFRCPERL